MELKDALRRARKQNKITQVQAAKAAGITESMYQFYEYGKNEPTANVLIALADFFDCSIDYLVGRSDTPYMLKDENVELLSPEELERVRKFRERNR